MMIADFVLGEADKIAATVIGVVGTVVLAWYRLRRVTAGDNKQTQADDATTAVITLLRAEVQRLADQNSKLAEIVNDLQLQIIRLHRENENLRTDVGRIKDASKTN